MLDYIFNGTPSGAVTGPAVALDISAGKLYYADPQSGGWQAVVGGGSSGAVLLNPTSNQTIAGSHTLIIDGPITNAPTIDAANSGAITGALNTFANVTGTWGGVWPFGVDAGISMKAGASGDIAGGIYVYSENLEDTLTTPIFAGIYVDSPFAASTTTTKQAGVWIAGGRSYGSLAQTTYGLYISSDASPSEAADEGIHIDDVGSSKYAVHALGGKSVFEWTLNNPGPATTLEGDLTITGIPSLPEVAGPNNFGVAGTLTFQNSGEHHAFGTAGVTGTAVLSGTGQVWDAAAISSYLNTTTDQAITDRFSSFMGYVEISSNPNLSTAKSGVFLAVSTDLDGGTSPLTNPPAVWAGFNSETQVGIGTINAQFAGDSQGAAANRYSLYFPGTTTGDKALLGGGVILQAAAPTVGASQVALGGTVATSASAGAHGDVPAQVLGYLIINVAGTTAKIPYYAN